MTNKSSLTARFQITFFAAYSTQFVRGFDFKLNLSMKLQLHISGDLDLRILAIGFRPRKTESILAEDTVPLSKRNLYRECILGQLEGPGISKSECPVCHQPAWKKDLRPNQKYSNISNILQSYAPTGKLSSQAMFCFMF